MAVEEAVLEVVLAEEDVAAEEVEAVLTVSAVHDSIGARMMLLDLLTHRSPNQQRYVLD